VPPGVEERLLDPSGGQLGGKRLGAWYPLCHGDLHRCLAVTYAQAGETAAQVGRVGFWPLGAVQRVRDARYEEGRTPNCSTNRLEKWATLLKPTE
jgi:hypothetical protein